eukprot:tig00000711_g3366.t2
MESSEAGPSSPRRELLEDRGDGLTASEPAYSDADSENLEEDQRPAHGAAAGDEEATGAQHPDEGGGTDGLTEHDDDAESYVEANNEEPMDEVEEEPAPPPYNSGNDEPQGHADPDEDEFPDDTTKAQAAAGKDIQGIPWEGLLFSRVRYRETRLRQYKNYENLQANHDLYRNDVTRTRPDGSFYEFRHNTRQVRSHIVHFQLRNLVWATSKHDVYLMYQYSILHYNPITRRSKTVLNLGGGQWGVGRVQISTMVVRDNFLVAGGFLGEMVIKDLARDEVTWSTKISHDENAITNAIELYRAPDGRVRVVTSNNDCVVRIFDAAACQPLHSFQFPWAVNHTTVSPDGRLLCVVGDDTDGMIADAYTGKPVATLKGHIDYSFASAWHPDGRLVATGNQDTTTRLWDVRYPSRSLACLEGRMGAIRSLRFTPDGRFLAAAEPADFVHIYDSASGYVREQEIDVFGEIAGISFTPDGGSLFTGIADRTYGSLLEFERCDRSLFRDCLL